MTDHPYPNIWAAIAARLKVDPLPAGEWRLLPGEHRLIGAVRHVRAEPEPEVWLCGAWSPPWPLLPYRCSEPAGHADDHCAQVDGRVVATWPRRANA